MEQTSGNTIQALINALRELGREFREVVGDSEQVYDKVTPKYAQVWYTGVANTHESLTYYFATKKYCWHRGLARGRMVDTAEEAYWGFILTDKAFNNFISKPK